MQSDLAWPQHYAALLRYGEEHNGNYNVPHKCVYTCDVLVQYDDGSAKLEHYNSMLGNWLHNQRQMKKGDLEAIFLARKVYLSCV